MTALPDIWTYLAKGPLLWLTMTLLAYVIGDAIFKRFNRAPYANPVMIATILVSALLLITGTPYHTYFEGAQFVHFMLGPATVSLAVPLYANRVHIRRALIPMLAALVAGSLTAVLVAIAVGMMMGLDHTTLVSLAPKSTTAPVAIGISEKVGGLPTLTAVLVLITGILGAIVVTPTFNALGLTDWRARGFATGVAAHGVGTARALQVNETAGAFAGIGMGLNALLTAVIVPYIVTWLL